MVKIIITDKKISPEQLKILCDQWFGDMVKVVADIEKQVIGIGGELHADAEKELIATESKPQDLWGANFYPWLSPENRIDFTALINIRPNQDNPAMEILNENIKSRMQQIIEQLILASNERLV
jgi:hypothetical protein